MTIIHEHRLPTIDDVHRVLSDLIAGGLGTLPVQIVVVPDSTLQAIARQQGASGDDKPALMIEFSASDDRHPVSIVSTERLGSTAPRAAIQ